jgi:prolipoprotein diacylglyceryltransferase
LLFFWLRPLRNRDRLADAMAPGLLFFSAGGWLGCYLEGCAFGALTTVGPLAADLPDPFGVFDIRYQTQLAGVLLSLAAAGVVFALQRRRGWEAGGRWFWACLLLMSAVHGASSLLRGDPMPQIGPLRADVLLDLLLGGIALLLALWPPRRPNPAVG